MAGSLYKNLIGIEDLSIQSSITDGTTFSRLGSTGSTVTLTKFAPFLKTPAVDPGDIMETIVAGTLTHDVIKSKINTLLAALRTAGIIA